MWSDNETTEDLLGFKVHADLIIDVIKDDTVLPITIGVFGDWGSGKSSILKIVEEEFEKKANNEDTLCIYFNGWTFEGYDDAKAALLNSIVKGIEENKKLSAEAKEKIKEKSAKLWKSINWMRGAGMVLKNVALPAVTAYFTGGLSLFPFATQKLKEWKIESPEQLLEKLNSEEGHEVLKSLTKEISKEESSKVNPVSEFRDDFVDLLKTTNFKRLVVIIDDLDRCKPERIIENLEAIKLFVNVPNTAFIIGADPRIVRHAIEYKYGKSSQIQDDNTRIIDDYLEKLIQLPYSLPKLSEPEVETYISMLICKKEVGNEKFRAVLEDFQKFRLRDKYSAYGLGNIEKILKNEDFEKVKSNIISIPALVPLITQNLYGNPRQIKRFLNTYVIRQRLSNVASINDFNRAILAKLMILEYSEIRLFRRLFEWQLQQEGKPEELIKLESICEESENASEELQKSQNKDIADWHKDKTVKWLKIEPKLSKIDLRDYFWIARDKITSSITASSLIPPIVKNLLNQLNQEMPDGTAKQIIQETFIPFSDFEKSSFFLLLSKTLSKNPNENNLFKIFHSMIDLEIEDAINCYINILNTINLNQIKASVGVSLRKYKEHPELGGFLTELFKKNNTKIAKSYNIKSRK